MAIDNLTLPHGLAIRPSTPADKGFIESLYRSTRDDLYFIDAETDFIETLIDQQCNAQTIGYGSQFPNAMYFIIEKLDRAVGRITIDFGNNEVRVLDIAFIPEARGKGYGEGVLNALKFTAGRIRAPLALSVRMDNWRAKNLYLKLGFQTEGNQLPYERMVWYPTAAELNG